MAIRSLLLGLILVSGVSLSACNRKAGHDAPGADPFATRSTIKEDQFGKGFGKAFRADRNAEPMNVTDGDIVPVSNSGEPVNL